MIQERNCDEKKLWGQALFISAAGDGHRQLRQGWNAGRHERRLGRHRGGGGDKIFLCLSSNHKTVENILERKAFTVSVADEAHLVEADYVGLVSGNDVPDKLKPLTFDPANGTYWSLGEKMGKAFSDGSQLK